MLSLPAAGRLVERARARIARSRPDKDSPRIALIGNCQAAAIGRAIRLLRPGAEVRYFSAGTLGRRRIRPDQLVMDLAGYDYVFAQRIHSGHVGPEHYTALAERGDAFRPVPAIVFAAFHPDLVYVGGPGTAHPLFVDSPVGHYHSALALHGYLADFTPAETLRLFRRDVFAFLGYLDLWTYAQDTLLGLGREAGMDLAPDLVRWARRGCFMHSVNHPKMFVLADIARLLLRDTGIGSEDYDLDSFLVDDLSLKGMWPVYEAVGRHYGVPDSHMFLAQSFGRKPAPPRVYNLPDFVEASFATYREQPRKALVSDRVESWLASDQLRSLFREWAA